MVSRPRYTDEDFDAVARGVAAGKHQKIVATELGMSLGSVKHCLGRMRAILAASHGQDWLDPHMKTSVQVAQLWLEARSQASVQEVNSRVTPRGGADEG